MFRKNAFIYPIRKLLNNISTMMKSTAFLLFFSLFLIDLSAQCANFSRPGVHVVQSGENLYRIAKRYNVSTFELAQWNNISADITLYACQELAVNNRNTNQNTTTFNNSSNRITSERTNNPSNEFTNRGTNLTNFSGPSFVKQSGNKHTIREGETISGLANLYGYTEERFRKINLLNSGDELSVGSTILSTDCACDRVVTYDEFGNGTTFNQPTTSINNNNISKNNTRANTTSRDNFQNRGGSDYDSFYDNDNGSFGGNTPPPAEAINDRRIRSAQSQSNAFNGGGTSTNRINTGGNNRNTPAPARATYMTADELTMLDEINLMRSNPSGYITYVEQYRRDIQSGRTFGSSLPVIDELIAELRRTPNLSILEPAPCIYEAARKHGLDQKARGHTGHDGSDGSWPWERVKRECSQMTDGNENLVGGLPDIRESVILLLVDDGISSRGHRKTLLEPKWRYGATYKIGKVGHLPNCWVQKFGF